ncbi:MAG TPA: kelch repeat-containing protein, partial [bacterium]|nr:kelch repeat-containing protein [bacterium]
QVEITLFSNENLSHAEITGFKNGETLFSENEIHLIKIIGADDSAGEYTFTATMKDELGNESSCDIDWKIVIEDKESVPEYLINMENILYKRNPWGSQDSDFTPVFSLSGKNITGDDDIVAIVVYSSINQLAGSAFLDDEKSFEIARLSSGNIGEMYVYPVTFSGVKLEALKVKQVEWTATLTGKVPYSTNENPNVIKTVTDFNHSLFQKNEFEPVDVSNLSTVDKFISVSGKRKWEKGICKEFPPEIYSHDIAFDSTRGVLVMFGGYGRRDTWEFDGKCWKKASLISSAPFPREGGRIAYSTKNGKMLLFGGHKSGGMMSNDIWEYDGIKWVDLTPSPLPSDWPPIRSHHGWDYNSGTGKFILFGGSFKNDIWEWNGTAFKKITVADSPSPRTATDIVYDSTRNVFVLFGGYTFDGYSDETWEFDGTDWKEIKPAQKPPARIDHAAAYDAKREKIVIFGGQDESNIRLSDTWEWDGLNWKQIVTANSPAPQREAAMSYDPLSEKMVLNGIVGSLLNDSGTWFYDGTDWTPLTKTVSPLARMDMGAAFDRKRGMTVIFGGYHKTEYMMDDTWEWDGRKWTEIVTLQKPSPRYGSRMAFDNYFQKVALFGGYDNEFKNDLWHFDGNNWEKKEHTDPVEPVSQHAFTDFLSPSGILIFGGISNRIENDGVISDLWNHSSSGFYQYVQGSGDWPERRTHHSMSYDREREVAVVYGGYYFDPDYRIELDETWEFDGSSWKQIYPAENPGKRSRHSS